MSFPQSAVVGIGLSEGQGFHGKGVKSFAPAFRLVNGVRGGHRGAGIDSIGNRMRLAAGVATISMEAVHCIAAALVLNVVWRGLRIRWQARSRPVTHLSVVVEGHRGVGRGNRGDRDIPAIHDNQRGFAHEVCPRSFDGNSFGFIRRERQIVIGVVSWQHAPGLIVGGATGGGP